MKNIYTQSIAIYKDIIDYFNGNLFNRIEIPILDIACASPAITVGGGYRRKDFMWCPVLGNNIHEITRLFAHETAHIWCTGANSGSWEDWLNETAAEWAVLLFALQKKDNELFDFIMKPKLGKFESLPPIKTIDNSRPEGVHDKGTVLFYEMYSLYGLDAIRKTIRLFTDLSDKTTASLVKKLYDMHENVIAGFIEESIVR